MDNVKDVYSRITRSIIADLERGIRPWLKPWNAAHAAGRITRPLRATGEPYRGVNILMLWSEAVTKGYACPIWITYRQAAELGGQVRKGEHGALVVYASRITRTEAGEGGAEIEREIPFLRGYTVFNCEQVDGLPSRFYAKPEAPLPVGERLASAEQFVARTLADIRHGGNMAYYAAEPDRIQLPCFEAFKDKESYYGTLLHELTHWTKHTSRLAREFGRKRWGDEGYAAEELVAELGAAFLCADLGVTLEPREDHAAYIGNWLKVLKNDKRAIFSAAAHAQRGTDYLHGLQADPQAEVRAAI